MDRYSRCYIDILSLSLRRHVHGTLAKHLMHMAHLSGNTSGKSKAVSQFQEHKERTCILVETGLSKLPWKSELGGM